MADFCQQLIDPKRGLMRAVFSALWKSESKNPFPTYTNGDRKRDKEEDKKQAEIFSKIIKDD